MSNRPFQDAPATDRLSEFGTAGSTARQAAGQAPMWLLVCVLALHLVGLDWLMRQTSGLSLLQTMAEPDFSQSLTPSAPTGTDAAGKPPVANMPPASTVGQVIQARTVQPTILSDQPNDPSSQLPRTQPKPSARTAQVPAASQPADVNGKKAPTPDVPLPAATQPEAAAGDPTAGTTQSALQPAPAEAAQASADPADRASPAAFGQAATPVQPSVTSPLLEPVDASAWLASWPRNTRLNYQLKGYYRGDFFGHARVQWQRNDQRYQTQIHVNVGLLVDMRMTSQGRITPTRLWPEAYEEERRGKKRGARFGDQLVTLDGGGTLNRVPHLQDTASQFVQLAQDFATGRIPLRVNAVVPVTLGRPGGVDDWLYDVVSQEPVSTGMGEVAAYHLKPRPLANPRGTVSAEIWFAPALQHMPVRIRLTLNAETWLDLTLDSAQTSE